MRLLVSLGLLLAVMGCASDPPKPAEPPPSLAESDPELDQEVAPASSALVKQGIDAIQAQDFAGAKEVLTQALQSAPGDAQAAFYLGVALEGLSDLPAAAEKYRLALENDPKLIEASQNLSAILLDTEDFAGALEVVDKAMEGGGKSAALSINRAIALTGLGKTKEALGAYEVAVAGSPDNLELRYTYAQLLAANHQKEQAIGELERVATSDDSAVVGAAANLLGRLKAFSKCVKVLDAALTQKKVADLYVRRGVCRHGAKDDEGAEEDYQLALSVDPGFAAAHYYLGQHYLGMKQKKKAKAAFEKTVELAGDTGVGKAAKKALEGL